MQISKRPVCGTGIIRNAASAPTSRHTRSSRRVLSEQIGVSRAGWFVAFEDDKTDPFKGFHTSPEIIRLAVMLYGRFPLLLRNVGDI